MASFNAKTVARLEQSAKASVTEVTVVPAGMYPVEIVRTDSYEKADDPSRYQDVTDPKKRRMEVMTVYYKVLEGDERGSIIKQFLTISHPSEKAVEIAHSKLAHICDSIGIEGFRDHQQLVGKQLRVRVGEKGNNNEFYGFYPLNEQTVTTQGGFAIASGDRRPAGRGDDW
jgi:hypothetical protein